MNTNALRSTRLRLAAAAVLSAGILGATAACAGTTAGAAVTGAELAPAAGHAAVAAGSSAASSAATGSHTNVPAYTTRTAPAVAAPAATHTPAPGTYISAAWLASGQMPLAQPGAITWDAAAGVGDKLGGDVYAASLPQIMACDSLGLGGALASGLGQSLTGTQYDTYQASNSDKIMPNGAIPAYAEQYALFYSNSAQASAAMNGLAADYASCAHEITGTDPSTGAQLVGSDAATVEQSSAQCWSVLSAGASGAGTATVDHTCFVRSGSVIAAVTVSVNQVGTLSTVDFGAVDQTTVSELRQSLNAYNSGS